MTDTPDPVTAGNDLTYTITATNNGPLNADAAAWSDTLPAGTTFTSLVTPSGWSCTNPGVGAGGTINCSAVGTFAPGSKVFTLVVTVSPSVAGGTVISNTAAITTSTADSNAANNSATATTTVTAAPQGNLVIAPTTLTFTNQLVGSTSAAQTVTLSNNGAASLDVTALTAANGAFARSGGSCAAAPPITLAVGANCTLQYTFAPSATGVANQSLTVTANAPGSGTIALSGTGVQGNLTITPSSVPFGNQTVGSTSAAQTVTLANNGTAALQVTTLSSAGAPFARSGGSCAAVAPITISAGANCTLQYTFAPIAAGAANQVLTVTADAPGSGAIALSGTGVTPEADVSLTITDGRQYVRVGESLNYTIVVTNAGPAAATATVGDALPATLSSGAWTCTPSGAATCANGSGNVLSDVATLPSGTHVTYIYSATVQLNAIEVITNSATATVGAGAVDPNTANNTAADATDVVVIFKDGFEDGGTTLALDGAADGFVSAQLQLDASLLAGVGVSPVTIATGETADARSAFTIELARFNGQYVMRLVTSTAEGSERSEWRVVDPGSRAVELAWQSATAGQADGYLHLAVGGTSLQSVARRESGHLARLRVAVDGGLPWLSLMTR
jgi:uncharacterized repeat protein (TIGR01451 family)